MRIKSKSRTKLILAQSDWATPIMRGLIGGMGLLMIAASFKLPEKAFITLPIAAVLGIFAGLFKKIFGDMSVRLELDKTIHSLTFCESNKNKWTLPLNEIKDAVITHKKIWVNERSSSGVSGEFKDHWAIRILFTHRDPLTLLYLQDEKDIMHSLEVLKKFL